MDGKTSIDSLEEECSAMLGDETDESDVSAKLGGSLRFAESTDDSNAVSQVIRSWSRSSQQSTSSASSDTSPRRGPHRVTFEIVSAKTVTQGKKKHVSYTLLIKRVPGLERQPGVIERRYSDFLNLFQSLKKRYPSLLSDFPFPRKALVGNFTAEVITERSVAFQHLLAYGFSVKEMRTSPEFAEFLYNREIREAHKLMKMAQFEDASVILENAYFVQEKLLGESHFSIFSTLCILVACLNAVDNVAEAQKYAEMALKHSSRHESSDLMIPFLILAIRLWWAVGKDKRDLEKRLQDLKQKGINVDRQPTLLELVMQREFAQEP